MWIQTGVMMANKAPIKTAIKTGACVCSMDSAQRYQTIIHKHRFDCLLPLLSTWFFAVNKGRWHHWSKDVYESPAILWRALTFQLVMQRSHFCSCSRLCSVNKHEGRSSPPKMHRSQMSTYTTHLIKAWWLMWYTSIVAICHHSHANWY